MPLSTGILTQNRNVVKRPNDSKYHFFLLYMRSDSIAAFHLNHTDRREVRGGVSAAFPGREGLPKTGRSGKSANAQLEFFWAVLPERTHCVPVALVPFLPGCVPPPAALLAWLERISALQGMQSVLIRARDVCHSIRVRQSIQRCWMCGNRHLHPNREAHPVTAAQAPLDSEDACGPCRFGQGLSFGD